MTITKDIHTDEQKQIIYNNHKNLTLSLRRSFNAFSEDIVDPIKYISNEIVNHAKNGGELPQGVYIFKTKQEALNTANRTGYALVEVNPQDDIIGVPASEYRKEKGFYCIETRWYFKEGKNREGILYPTSMKSILLNWLCPGRIFIPNKKKWSDGVVYEQII